MINVQILHWISAKWNFLVTDLLKNVQVFVIGYVNIWLFCRKLAKYTPFSWLICWIMKFSRNRNFEMCNFFFFAIHCINRCLFFRNRQNWSLLSIMKAEIKHFLSFDFLKMPIICWKSSKFALFLETTSKFNQFLTAYFLYEQGFLLPVCEMCVNFTT